MIRSKRFWAVIAVIAGAVGSVYAGEITWLKAAQLVVGAIGAAVISDGVRKIGS